MEICEKEENNRLNETIEKVEKSKINKINQPKKIINECIIQNSPLVNIDSKVANVSKSICKIKIEFKRNNYKRYRFFIKILYKSRIILLFNDKSSYYKRRNNK